MKKALPFGIFASLFFAFTFIFNRSMNLTGGYWLWSAVLRYLFMLPILAILVMFRHGMREILFVIRKDLLSWLLWSTVGFGLFYMPLSMASIYGESWFVAATWQVTIVAGVVLTPLFGQKIPAKNLAMSGVILAGIFLLQITHLVGDPKGNILKALILILIAAFSYPGGNRKMMQHCPPEISTIQRVFGMTLCSMPFWIVMGIIAFIKSGVPSASQSLQSLIVAIFSGVIATILFFDATNLVKDNPRQLAVIEATQSGEVLFTLLGGIVFLHDSLPSVPGIAGIVIIVCGMIGNSLLSTQACYDPSET